MPCSVIIMPIAAPSPSGSRPSSAYGGAGAPLRLLRLGDAVLLRCFPGRDQGLAGEADAAQLAGHSLTAPPGAPSSGRAARPGGRSVPDAAPPGRAGGPLVQLLQPRRQQVLGYALPRRAGGRRRGGDGVRAVGLCRNQGRPCSDRNARRASASASCVRPSTARASAWYSPTACCAACNAVNADASAAACGIGLQGGYPGDRQQLLPRGDAVTDSRAGPGDAGRDAARIAQIGGPGRRQKTGLTDQCLSLTAVVARLAQPGRPTAPAVLARQRLADHVGGRGLTLAVRLLGCCHTDRIAPGPLRAGLLRAGLLLTPREALRLDGRVLAQPLLRGRGGARRQSGRAAPGRCPRRSGRGGPAASALPCRFPSRPRRTQGGSLSCALACSFSPSGGHAH
ncbi:hypothetical protein OEIGOIKO_00621 [Streptomyces chrestomyceticus JCM 4735]|uniref:Uncharacterized protein n=1 Tax=Streptomyces chrestomyceticus JCM 4735 TaxID=1306181 RepID=A0A7U9PV82_9ACTN|nr:hypothetical protein OEIGOIKO_00621 [Streptomyces chrestomyceticus JCM 4735]